MRQHRPSCVLRRKSAHDGSELRFRRGSWLASRCADRRSASQGCRVALTSLPVVGAASGCTQNVTRNLVVSLASGIVLLI